MRATQWLKPGLQPHGSKTFHGRGCYTAFPERCIVYGYVLEGRGPVGALEQLVPTSPTVNILIIGMLATAPGDLRLGKGQCGQWKKNALGEPAHAPKR